MVEGGRTEIKEGEGAEWGRLQRQVRDEMGRARDVIWREDRWISAGEEIGWFVRE